MGMRVIAGTAKGHILTSPKGLDTRPTAGRVREAIFSSLFGRLAGAGVCDMFAGSGAMGVEALSRGAASCVFFDNDESAAEAIRQNLAKTRLRGQVVLGDALESVSCYGPFDIVFIDPPYEENLYEEALAAALPALKPSGMAVLETAGGYEPSAHGFDIIKQKDYNIARIHYLIKT